MRLKLRRFSTAAHSVHGIELERVPFARIRTTYIVVLRSNFRVVSHKTAYGVHFGMAREAVTIPWITAIHAIVPYADHLTR